MGRPYGDSSTSSDNMVKRRSGRKLCWKCGTNLALAIELCPNCGEKQDEAPEIAEDELRWTCPYCKREMPRRERGSHVCKEMSDARMARARENIKAPRVKTGIGYHVFMLASLGLFLWGVGVFAAGRGPILSRKISMLLLFLLIIAFVQTFAFIRKQLVGAGGLSLMLYNTNILLLVLAVLVFSSRGMDTARALAAVWFVNTYLLRSLGRKKFVFFIGQYVLLGVVIGAGILLAPAAAMEKFEALVVLFGGVLG